MSFAASGREPAALAVAQELVAQPDAGVGALQQARDVREHGRPEVGLADAQVRRQRRERVIRHLRPRRAHLYQKIKLN